MKFPTRKSEDSQPETLAGDLRNRSRSAPEPDQLDAEAVGWLVTRAPSLEVRAMFLPESRRRLLARLGRQAGLSGWERLWAAPRFRFAAHAVSFSLLALVIVSFISVLLSAARIALPGEPFYAIKLGSERVRLGVSLSDEARAVFHVSLARERSNELQALIIEGDYAQVEIASWRMLQEVETARRYLGRAEGLSVSQRQVLAQELHQILMMQRLVLIALMYTAPPASQPLMQHLLFVSQ